MNIDLDKHGWIALLISLLFLALTSCSTFKESVKTSTQNKKTKNDSVVKKEVNKAIDNTYTIPLRTGDDDVDEKIAKALSNYSAGSKSGSNSTNITFDKDLMSFLVQSKVGETLNESTNTNSEKTLEEQTDEYFEKKIHAIPFWFYVLLFILFLPNLIKIAQMILNPLSIIINKYKF